MPALDHHNHPKHLERLLPWSSTLPQECYCKSNPERDEEASSNTIGIVTSSPT